MITDPHIKLEDGYFVYDKGSQVVAAKTKDGLDVIGAFIRNREGHH